MSKLEEAALGIATGGVSTAINGALGMALGAINDKRQLKQQGKLQAQQIEGNKQMIDYQKMKDLEMWKNTSYGAQKEQMKLAGLNPGLMYGMGGGGGVTTGGSGASVSGGNAPNGGMEIMNMLQMRLMEAERKNIEADTANKEADAIKKGAETENIGFSLKVAKALENSTIMKGMAEADISRMSMEEQNLNFEAFKTAIAGSMEDDKNPLVISKKAEVESKLQVLDNMRKDYMLKVKDGNLKDADLELKKIEAEINGFTADLTDMGINNTTMGLIIKVLGGLMGMRVKGGKK